MSHLPSKANETSERSSLSQVLASIQTSLDIATIGLVQAVFMVDSVFTTLAISSLFFQTVLAKGGGGTGSSSHGSGGGGESSSSGSSSSKSSPSKSGSGSGTIHHTTPICYDQ